MRRSSTVALVCLLLLAAVLALGLLAPHLVSSPAARGRSHQDARSAASNALQIARILIALVIAASCRTETVSNMHRHRSSLAAAMQAAQQQTSHPLDAWQAIRQQQQQQQQYTLQDLLVVIPTTHERLSLVEAGRAWREGMQAHIVLEKPLDAQLASKGLLKGRKKYRETYGSYPDAHASHVWSQPGDARAAVAAFAANQTISMDKYKWILYGDDDTVWVPENVLKMLNGLDHTMPYFLSDHIWFPEWHGREKYVHASRRAPRCLPCNYQDPLESTGVGARLNAFQAVKACPCTMDALCRGADNPGIINGWDCRFSRHGPNWWYFAHGGAGAVLSSGLMSRSTYEEVERKVRETGSFTSGDCAFTDIIWDKMRILPTDPGPAYYREHVRLFDPGWRGPQAKGGRQDDNTQDLGNDPLGLAARFEAVLEGRADLQTIEALDLVVSSHVRSRFIVDEVNASAVAQLVHSHLLLASAPKHLQPTAYLHFHLTRLAKDYHALRRSALSSVGVAHVAQHETENLVRINPMS